MIDIAGGSFAVFAICQLFFATPKNAQNLANTDKRRSDRAGKVAV
jgi:hypothetical protein